MNRGSRSLYSSLFEEDQTNTSTLPKPERKGRSEILIAQRNELLVYRYYYHAKIQEKKYMKALTTLEKELFLSTRTITDILSEHNAQLQELVRTKKPTVKELRELFPMMVWIEPKN